MSRGLPLFKEEPLLPLSPLPPLRFSSAADFLRGVVAAAVCCCGLTLLAAHATCAAEADKDNGRSGKSDAARARQRSQPQPQNAAPPAASATPTPAAAALAPQTTPAVAPPPGDTVGRVFAACKDAVVRIVASEPYGLRVGTGFFIDPNGTIYTHSSVGGQTCWDITVEFRDQLYPAICLLSDPRSGVTMLKITAADTPFLPIGRSDALEIAAPVIVVGYPPDLPVSPSSGMVAGIDQKVLGEFQSPALIRANLLIQPGEQGAPLLNARGEAVGIVAGRLLGSGGTAVYALPIKAAEKLRRDFARFGEPRPGWVGVTISPPPELVNDEGTQTRVGDMTPDGPAARAGLRDGDVLLRVGDTAIRRPSDILEASFYLTGGDAVPFAVSRDGEEKMFTVLAADHPATRRGQEERLRLLPGAYAPLSRLDGR